MDPSQPSPSTAQREAIEFRHSASLPGIEVLDALNTAHKFHWFHTAFGVGLPTTWHGEIRYRQRQQAVGPGMALCTAPGELSTMPRITHKGTFNALMFEPEVFLSYATEHQVDAQSLEWRVISGQASTHLARRFASFLAVLGPNANPMELQSSLVDVFEALVQELLVDGGRSPGKVSRRSVERMREMLHSSEGTHLDLNTLAEQAGMTRYQALRAFKGRYGLPPHAYQLCAQLGQARDLLRSGRSATDVALVCGFSDQSHFGRHFKRVFGVTPGTYAKAHRAPRSRGELTALHASDRRG